MPQRPLFQRVCIVGVGLIGGSIGLALRARKAAGTVAGVVRRHETARRAVAIGALDRATFDLADGLRDADLVVLCAPVSTILRQLGSIGRHLKPGAVVIDVGSTKSRIVDEAERRLRGAASFVGCHPMAGSEKQGIEHADGGLFEGEICFVTGPDPRIARFWRRLGSRVVVCTPERHDRWAALASHLPHLAAFSLFANPSFRTLFPGRLNPSARDLARIARGAVPVWADIFLTNRKPIRAALADFRASLDRWDRALRAGDGAALRRLIGSANAVSRRLEKLER